MKRLFSLAFGLAALNPPSAAFAAAARLVYQHEAGAASCADEAALRRSVAGRVGYDPFDAAAPLTITVDVTAKGRRLYGRVVVVDKSGTEKGRQTLESTDANCDDLMTSIALALSVVLDSELRPAAELVDPPAPQSVNEAPSPIPALVLSASPAPPAVTSAEHRDAPKPARDRVGAPRPWSLWVGLGPRASFGWWSSVALGPDLLVELRANRFGVGIEGRYDRTALEAGAIATGMHRVTASLLPCVHFGPLVTCGLATVGHTWTSGNVTVWPASSAPFVAFGGRLGLEVPILSKVRLLGAVDAIAITTHRAIWLGEATSTPGSSNVETSAGSESGPVEVSGGIALTAPIF